MENAFKRHPIYPFMLEVVKNVKRLCSIWKKFLHMLRSNRDLARCKIMHHSASKINFVRRLKGPINEETRIRRSLH